MSRNGLDKNIRFSIISKLKERRNSGKNQSNEKTGTDISEEVSSKIWLRIPFLGKHGEFLVKRLIKKIQRNLTRPVKLIVIYQTKKVSYFLSRKDKSPDFSRSNLVYQLTCPGCSKAYIGKTERNWASRLSEHSDPLKSAIPKHLTNCEHANLITDLNNLCDNLNSSDIHQPDPSFSHKIPHFLQITNSNHLLFLEALHIKFTKLELNTGLKASKELVAFP